MKLFTQFRTMSLPFLGGVVLASFGLAPGAQATDLGSVVPGNNTADGSSVLINRTTGVNNSGFGFEALKADTSGSFNTATGIRALYTNVTGSSNTATGAFALAHNTASDNTAIGYQALYSNTVGVFNTATGYRALYHNTNGAPNTATGYQALYANISGFGNTAMGAEALVKCTGSGNTALGDGAGIGVTTATNVICIGAGGAEVSNSCYIGNIWNQPGGPQPVYVNSDGKLGLNTSSRRFKDEIKPMQQASEVIYGLKPVSFRYKPEIEPTRPVGFGLIAEEVEKLNPDLVTRGNDDKAYAVRYDAVNAMLLNEFLKEHKAFLEERRKVQELEVNAARQQKQIEALTASLQKVSAQLKASKTAPQTVASNTQ